VIDLELSTFAARNRAEATAFQAKANELYRAVSGALRVADDAQTRLAHIRKVILDTPAVDPALLQEEARLRAQLNDLLIMLRGDRAAARREYPTGPSISSRIRRVVYGLHNTTAPPTQTHREQYKYAADEFADVLAQLRILVEQDLVNLEQQLEAAGAPWTPGRGLPEWKHP